MSWLLGTIATEIGSTLSDMNLAGAVAADLEDDELLKLLARAANAVYELGDGDGIKLTNKGEMSAFYGVDGGRRIQYGLYQITEGYHKGETIMAFRGTNIMNCQQVLQDISMKVYGLHISAAVKEANRIAEEHILAAVKEANRIAEESRPTWLTGHSLGGFLAECVCSHTAIPGASFAAPGPIGFLTPGNMLTGERFHKVEWKTVINRKDIIATTIGGIGGSQSSHLVRSNNILWLDFGGFPSDRHSMEQYIKHLEDRGSC